MSNDPFGRGILFERTLLFSGRFGNTLRETVAVRFASTACEHCGRAVRVSRRVQQECKAAESERRGGTGRGDGFIYIAPGLEVRQASDEAKRDGCEMAQRAV